jgi:hypothetical protein
VPKGARAGDRLKFEVAGEERSMRRRRRKKIKKKHVICLLLAHFCSLL